MYLQQYLDRTPADVTWGPEDEVSLEEDIGTLRVLAAEYTNLVQSIEQYEFILKVAQHHPDSPALESLGVANVSTLSASMESGGEGRLRRVWEAIKSFIQRLYKAVMSFFKKVTSSYDSIIKNAKEQLETLDQLPDFKDVVVEVNNPIPLSFKGELEYAAIGAGLLGNMTYAKFFEKEYVEFVKNFYENVSGAVDKDKDKDIYETIKADLLKKVVASNSVVDGPQMAIGLGEWTLVVNGESIIRNIKVNEPEEGKLIDYARSADIHRNTARLVARDFGGSTATDITFPNKSKVKYLLKLVSDVCTVAKESERKTRDIEKIHRKLIKKIDAKDDATNSMMKAANVDLVNVLVNFHTANYRSCREFLKTTNKIKKAVKVDASDYDKKLSSIEDYFNSLSDGDE